MPADRPPQLSDVRDAVAYLISPADTVALAPLRAPDDAYDASVFLEIWEPGGAQPPNSHPRSIETFFVLRGEALAHCDDHTVSLRAGQLLVLPPASVHWIANVGEDRLYAVTTMTPDDGFHRLVANGTPKPLEEADLALFAQAAGVAPAVAPAERAGPPR